MITDYAAELRREQRHAVGLLLIAIAFLLSARLATLGLYPLADNTEARYALIGRYMLEGGDWITPYVSPGVPFWGKPPLSFWATSLSFALFGVNEFAARLTSFGFVTATACLVFVVGRTRGDNRFAALAVLIFLSSALPFYLAGGVMTDPALMFTVSLMMAAFWKSIESHSRTWGLAFFAGGGLTMLAKGPVGIVTAGIAICAFVAWNNLWRESWRKLPWLLGTTFAVLIAAPWYIAAEVNTPGFLRYFILGEHFQRFLVKDWSGDLYGAPRTRPYGTVLIFLLAGALPWSATLLGPLLGRWLRNQPILSARSDAYESYLVCWIAALPLLFMFAKAVLWPYVALSMPAFGLLAALIVHKSSLSQRLIIATSLILPTVSFGAVTFLSFNPTFAHYSTQKSLVQDFADVTRRQDVKLRHYPSVPFSAEFYMPGRNVAIASAEALDQEIENSNALIAMKRSWFDRLAGETRSKLEILSEVNGTVLVRARTLARSASVNR